MFQLFPNTAVQLIGIFINFSCNLGIWFLLINEKRYLRFFSKYQGGSWHWTVNFMIVLKALSILGLKTLGTFVKFWILCWNKQCLMFKKIAFTESNLLSIAYPLRSLKNMFLTFSICSLQFVLFKVLCCNYFEWKENYSCFIW